MLHQHALLYQRTRSFFLPFLVFYCTTFSLSTLSDDIRINQNDKQSDYLYEPIPYLMENDYVARDTTWLKGSTKVSRILNGSVGDENSSNKKYGAYSNEHKKFFPMNKSDYFGIAFSIIALGVASGGGIGGGGVLVPILILVMKFTTKRAIPISNVTVVGGAIANVCHCIGKRHPVFQKPLVDWDLIMMMEPLTILGAWLGTIANKLLPEIIVTISLVALLSMTATVTIQKAVCLYQNETIALTASANKEECTTLIQPKSNCPLDETYDSISPTDVTKVYWESPKLNEKVLTETNPELQTILANEQFVPRHNLMVLLSTVIVVLIVNLLSGGSIESTVGMDCKSMRYWAVSGFLVVFVIAISIHSRLHLLHIHHMKQSCHYYDYYDTETNDKSTSAVVGTKTKVIQWNETNTIIYPALSMIAGFFAGLFGIGK
jgi:Sulfite exporter TauE/SafE